LWASYELWCKFFNQEREHDEMARRFSTFKETLLMVDRHNKSRLPYRLEISRFADGKLRGLVSPKYSPVMFAARKAPRDIN
ncbi:hypothetical protein BAE44_0011115, partial [Dichanthelium oligosanthes]